MATEKISNSNIYANAYISEDWGSGPGSDSGYKLEVDLSSDLVTPDWMLNFNLDLSYSIRKAYGVDLIDNGNGNYTFEVGTNSVPSGNRTLKIVIEKPLHDEKILYDATVQKKNKL